MESIIQTITALLNHYGFFGIFILMIAENIGLPLPTELGFIVGQSMVSLGHATYATIFVTILAGKTVGSLVSYFLGRYFAGKIKFLNRDSTRLKKAQDMFASWMDKYGNLAVFLSRLIGYVRPWSSYLAGIGEIKFVPFIIYNVLGSATIIVITMLVLGTAVNLWQVYPVFRPIAIGLFLIFFFGFWIGLWIHNKFKNRKNKK